MPVEKVVKTLRMPGVWFAALMKSLATFSNCGGCEVGAVLQPHGEAGLSAHSAHGRRDEHGRLRFFDLVEARGDHLRNAIDGEALGRPLARVVDDGKDRPDVAGVGAGRARASRVGGGVGDARHIEHHRIGSPHHLVGAR